MPPANDASQYLVSMDEDERLEIQMRLLEETIIALLSRGMRHTMNLPQNAYRRRLHFEGLASLGRELDLIACAACALIRTAGRDLEAD